MMMNSRSQESMPIGDPRQILRREICRSVQICKTYARNLQDRNTSCSARLAPDSCNSLQDASLAMLEIYKLDAKSKLFRFLFLLFSSKIF